MIQDLLGAVTSVQAYRRFGAEKAGRTALYLFFLSLLFTVGGTIAMKIRLGPTIDQTFEWLEKDVPTLTFDKGGVTAATPEAKRIAHPAAPEVALMIDTARTTPVTAADLKEAKVLAYLTNNALYMEEREGELKAYDLKKAGLDKPVVVDAKFFREAGSAVKSVVFPIAIVTVFLFSSAWLAFSSLLFGLVGMVMNSIAGGAAGFGTLFQLAVHAQTASLLLRIVMAFLPFFVPFSGLLTLLVTGVYLWLGVKANVPSGAVSDA